VFPDCFVCGMNRRPGDGLRIFPGPVTGQGLWAAPWKPDPSVAGPDGRVRPEVVWAALDCPGYFAARSDGVPMLLGEFNAHVDRRVHISESCVIVGWRPGKEKGFLPGSFALSRLAETRTRQNLPAQLRQGCPATLTTPWHDPLVSGVSLSATR